MRVHVIVAEADPLICEGLAASLGEEPRLAAYPSTEPPEKAVEQCRGLRPGVLLLSEPYLQTMDLAHFARQTDWGRGVVVLVLGPGPDPEKLRRCLHLGCMGYVHRRESLAVLRKAVYAVASGQMWAPRAVLTTLLRQLIDSQEQVPRLTPRERQILALIGEGCGNGEISTRLYISSETVRWHVRRLLAKIGAPDRAQAAEYARRTFFSVQRPAAPPLPLPVRSAAWPQRPAAAIAGS